MGKTLRNAVAILVFALLPGLALAQEAKITGKVTDTDGMPLPGATVSIASLSVGGATDLDGRYTIDVPAALVKGQQVDLIARFVGFANATQTVTLRAGAQTIDFRMRLDLLNMDEVVVTGTGTATSRKRVAIDVGSVSSDQLSTAANLSFDAALAGKVAGAQITQSGQPGSPSNIILRGINTLGSTRPMILIDGVEVDASNVANGSNAGSSRMADIDFSDIERIEVVKGAAAGTLYGAQGANGVIQLFTKSGQAGRPRVTVNSSHGYSEFLRGGVAYSDVHSYSVDTEGNIAGLKKDEKTQIWTIPTQPTGPDAISNKPYKINGQDMPLFDNVGAIFSSAPTTQGGVSINGGTPMLTYLASANAYRQEGIEEAVGYWRNSFRLNLGSQLRDDLKIDTRVNIVNSQNKGETVNGNSVNSQIGSSLVLPRYIDIKELDLDTGMYLPMHQASQTSNSPLFYKQINDRNAELVRTIGNFNANYTPFKFLELDYKFGADHWRNQFAETQINVQNIPNNGPVLNPEGFSTQRIDKNSQFNSNLSAFLRTDLQKDFGINLPVASQTQLTFDWRKSLYQRVTAQGFGLPPIAGLTTLRATQTQSVDEYRETFATYGLLLNQKFDLSEWGGFSVGGRYDKSSAFGEGEAAEFFPRADGFVRFSELFFPASVKNTVTEFKVRAAYGEAGVQPGAFTRIITLNQGTIGTSGYFGSPSTLANPLLRVQRSKEFEVGSDIGFRFGQTWLPTVAVNATYWDRESEDAIDLIEIAPSTGATRLNSNSYLLDAKGIDLSVQSLVFYNKNFSWNATVNFGKQKSIVDKVSNGEDFVLNVNSGQTFVLREGEAVGAHLGYRALASLDETKADGSRYIPEANVGEYALVNGRVVNIASRKVIFRAQQEIIGDPTPDFTLSLRNDFTVARNLTMGIQFDWVQGPDVYNATKQRMYQQNIHAENAVPVNIPGAKDAAGAELGPQAYYAYYNSIYNTNNKNEFFIEDGSFVKLRELSLSYDFAPLLRKLSPTAVNKFTLNFTGRNLLTWTDYTGFDPEVNASINDSRLRGYDYNTYPNFRTYTVGLTATF